MKQTLLAIVWLCWPCWLLAADASDESEGSPVTFEADIRPILKAHCFLCHGEEETEGKLDLRMARLMLAGGDSGQAIVPHKPDESFLVERVESGEMPPGKKKLTSRDVALLRRWIKEGAKTARPEPENVEQAEFTAEERAFWSFQPVLRPAIPAPKERQPLRTPIDAFLLARLEQDSLQFSPEADKLTLLRRAYFDLLGLPPTPDEVDRFLADDSPGAWERLIDELLASPHYGERWGRHWLDVAGYADSDGYSDKDIERPYAYKYRDYVIRALNEDRPLDRFIQEQVAGDEMVESPQDSLSPRDTERLIATGFLRMGPDGTGDREVEQSAARNEVVAETIKIVSTSLLGLSVGCAQCHNHRFDPISHVDYHRLRAIFEPAYNWKAWRDPQQRLISLWSPAEREAAAKVQVELDKLATERREFLKPQVAAALEKELAKLPENAREKVGEQVRAELLNPPPGKQPDKRSGVFKKYPQLFISEAVVRRLDPMRYQADLKEFEAKVAEVKKSLPPEDFIHALTEVPGELPTTYLFARGDFNQPKHEVGPGELAVLTSKGPIVPAKDPRLATSGRRLAYARHLTSGEHPLTARVLVNRVWLHHFGRGIVGTPSEFGVQGERPTHPELLDWLASELVAGGWRLKPLHKVIMTSAAYRQQSTRSAELDAIDPENRLLARMNVRRLDAETIRDAVLTVSGKLNSKLYGPASPVAPDSVGQVVLGIKAGGRDGRVNKLKGGEAFRRSVYVQMRRTLPLAMLQAFDAPTMAPNCELRSSSTVTPQSLLLMNNDFIVEQSALFAQRVMREAGSKPVEQLRRAWRLALSSEPTPNQLSRAQQFYESQKKLFADKEEKDPADLALAVFCQFLVSNNAFLYVD